MTGPCDFVKASSRSCRSVLPTMLADMRVTIDQVRRSADHCYNMDLIKR